MFERERRFSASFLDISKLKKKRKKKKKKTKKKLWQETSLSTFTILYSPIHFIYKKVKTPPKPGSPV